MALVSWNPSYSVKVEKCDTDHKKLFDILNKLHEAMSAGNGNQVVAKVVKELGDYTKFHFGAEEKMMEQTHYPKLAEHRAQHKIYVSKVEQFQKDVEKGVLGKSVEVLNFLTDWLTSHIKKVDQQYSAHLNANGIS